MDSLLSWRERVYDGGNLRTSEDIWCAIILHRKAGTAPASSLRDRKFVVDPPAGLSQGLDLLRTELLSSRTEDIISQYESRVLSEWDFSISTRYEGSDPKAYLAPLTSAMVRSNRFAESWARHLGDASFEQLDELFRQALSRREELGMSGVNIEFPGLWVLRLGSYIARAAQRH